MPEQFRSQTAPPSELKQRKYFQGRNIGKKDTIDQDLACPFHQIQIRYHFIVVGGGTNCLAAAAYLSRQGLRILVLERQSSIGGGAVTRELTLPGYHHDIFATSINMWKASPVQEDLQLDKYGYKEYSPDPVASTPFTNGKAVTLYKDLEKTVKSISQFSEKDALRFRQVIGFYQESKEILTSGLSAAPLPFETMMSTLEKSDTGLDFLQLSYLSSRDWLEENFESEEVKAFLALWGSNHVPLSPEDAGGALFIIVFIGLIQDKGVGVPAGGMKSVADALRKFIEAHNGIILTGTEVVEILLQGGRAVGVKTKNGKTYSARKGIVAGAEPKSLFLKLLPEGSIPSDFKKKVEKFRYSSVTEVMIHAALDKWLDYRAEGVGMSGMVQIGDSLDQISRAYNDCVIGRPPSEPFMTIDNTTCYDTTRAPRGKHILWNFARLPL